MIIDWSKSDIKQEISRITWAATDPRMDGFVTWGCKQDLYELLWFVQEQLNKCSTYAGEEEFVKQVLNPYLNNYGKHLNPTIINTKITRRLPNGIC
jgi:hypothetical protein